MNRISISLKKKIQRLRLVVFDFDGVFTDNHVYVLEDGSEALRFWRGDGLGLERLRRAGMDLMVLSTEKNKLVSSRCAKLKIKCIQGVSDKVGVLKSVLNKKKIPFCSVAFVGNDINDRECLKQVGVPVVVCDARKEVYRLAVYRTRTRGGKGAVREVCDLIAAIKKA